MLPTASGGTALAILKEHHSALVSPLRVNVSASVQVQDLRHPCIESLSHEKQSSTSLNQDR